jgi:ATP-dependent RNA circularization protein (DNA/RNA ligase family)
MFYVFGVFDLKQRCWLSFHDMVSVCAKLHIPTVEFVQRGDCFAMDLKELLKLAQGVYPNTTNQREGIVVRSIDRSISFKVISNAYRLKNDC